QAKLSHRATSGRPQWLIAASRSGREGSAQPTLRLRAACRARSSADERVAPAKQVRVAPLGAVPHLAKSRRARRQLRHARNGRSAVVEEARACAVASASESNSRVRLDPRDWSRTRKRQRGFSADLALVAAARGWSLVVMTTIAPQRAAGLSPAAVAQELETGLDCVSGAVVDHKVHVLDREALAKAVTVGDGLERPVTGTVRAAGSRRAPCACTCSTEESSRRGCQA